MANGIESLSFHDANCSAKWDSILNEKNLKNSTSKSFISIIMRKTEQKLLKEKEEKQKPTRSIWS